MKRVRIYTRFEVFWHWCQALLVISLAFTGFSVRFPGRLGLNFEAAVELHRLLGVSLALLTVFAVFWHFTTGAWQQYLPGRRRVWDMLKYYGRGIFKGETHPVKRTVLAKINPLQRWVYLVLKLVLMPALLVSGMLYLYPQLRQALSLALASVAVIHVAMAYMILMFLLTHVYLSSTGRTPSAHFKAMLTGYDELED